jgi:hypothetical protein
MKRMEFQDLATMEKVMPANEKDPECRALIDKFESYTINISRKPYIKWQLNLLTRGFGPQ